MKHLVNTIEMLTLELFKQSNDAERLFREMMGNIPQLATVETPEGFDKKLYDAAPEMLRVIKTISSVLHSPERECDCNSCELQRMANLVIKKATN